MEKEIWDRYIQNEIPYEEAKEQCKTEFLLTCKLGIELMNAFKSLQGNAKINNNYFITIRPDEKKITFQKFYDDIYKLVQRKCFLSFKLSFEQKGTDNDSIGKGFHVHIIATMKQTSPGNVLRDIHSSVKDYTAFNCIDVKKLYTQQDVDNVENYIVEYKSDDDHKIATKEYDHIWREKNNIKNIYENIYDLAVPNNGTNIINMLAQRREPTIKSSGVGSTEAEEAS